MRSIKKKRTSRNKRCTRQFWKRVGVVLSTAVTALQLIHQLGNTANDLRSFGGAIHNEVAGRQGTPVTYAEVESLRVHRAW